MYEDLNESQVLILKHLKEYIDINGYPPSIREICKAVNYKSTSSVYKHLNTLEKQGYIRKDPSKPRAIEILNQKEDYKLHNHDTLPLLGEVVAGIPVLAQESIYDSYSLPKSMANNGDFILRVNGDSMINVGIYDQDYIVVQSQNNALNGEIVVALLDDSATLKRFFKEEDTIRLQPENDLMEPIYTKNIKILGVVRGLYRKF